MLLKCVLVLLAISSVKQVDAQLSTIQEWQDKLRELLDAYSDLDLSEVIQQLANYEQLTKVLVYFLENYSENGVPEEALCMLEVILTSDEQTQARVIELIEESINYIRLVQERNELKAECDAIVGEGLLITAMQQNCRLKLQNQELHVQNSAARIRLLVTALRGTLFTATECVSSILNE